MGMEGTGPLWGAEEVEAERADQLSISTPIQSVSLPWPHQEVAMADCTGVEVN